MSKTTLLTIAVIGLLVLNIAVVSFLFLQRPPHPHPGIPGMQGEGPKRIIIERLHFDLEQVNAYEDLITRHQVAIREKEDSIRQLKNALYATLKGPSTAVKDSLVERLAFLQQEIELIHYHHFEEIKALCKPAQLKDYNNLTEDLANFFAPPKKKFTATKGLTNTRRIS